jgi:hypothetical protein
VTAEKKSITIPWSPDPEENQRNIQAAINAGYTEINGERDENGKPRLYDINGLPVPEGPAILRRLQKIGRNEGNGHGA